MFTLSGTCDRLWKAHLRANYKNNSSTANSWHVCREPFPQQLLTTLLAVCIYTGIAPKGCYPFKGLCINPRKSPKQVIYWKCKFMNEGEQIGWKLTPASPPAQRTSHVFLRYSSHFPLLLSSWDLCRVYKFFFFFKWAPRWSRAAV